MASNRVHKLCVLKRAKGLGAGEAIWTLRPEEDRFVQAFDDLKSADGIVIVAGQPSAVGLWRSGVKKIAPPTSLLHAQLLRKSFSIHQHAASSS